MPRFFVPRAELGENFLVLTGENAAHARVLRLKNGDAVTVCDGEGEEWHCVVSDVAPGQVSLVVQEHTAAKSEAAVFCSVYMAFAKADKFEHVIQKATELGAKVVAMSDSNGYIHDPNGIQLDVVKDIKLGHRGRIKEYAQRVPGSTYTEGFRGIWSIPCDIALPCATQNEITAAEAEEIVKGGAMAVAEGANMPSTPEAIEIIQKAGLLFAPAKAANAGGVATSALEMSQNSMRYSWTFEEVDAKLHDIMVNIFHNINDAAKEYGQEGNLVAGANLAGFKKVAEAMMAQGIV